LKQKLPVEIADINSIQINLQIHKRQPFHCYRNKRIKIINTVWSKRDWHKMHKLHRPLFRPAHRCYTCTTV